ncbi:hypothetical protein ACF060_31495 [Streptomyces werraensis]|uniref:hypothetical protein n=1 Tax=Streptomyces werraensis TaxID=68284 RepID=UPI0036F56241
MNQPHTPTQTPTTAEARPAFTERAIAYATITAPLATGVTAPFLDGSAAVLGGIAYGGIAGFLAANYMNRLPNTLLHQLPAGDIIRAHRTTLFGSTLTTGMALLMGTTMGPAGTDALMAGILDIPANPVPGIVSLGWWAAVGLIPYKLRRVLARPRTKPLLTPTPGTPAAAVLDTPAKQIAYRWHQVISNPDNGTHRGQNLTVRTLSTMRWQGTITAPTGQSVTVTPDTVSSAYQVPAAWISLRPGAHAGEAHITVNLQAPPELDPTTLQGAWTKWVARTGGVMPGTHLENIQDDPNTGGQVALVVADDDTDSLTHPDRKKLAGALRVSNPLLISYEPRQNPREAVIRKMAHNPLEKGAKFPGIHVLKPNKNGYIQLGPGVSGFPARIQLFDPNLGAQHVLIAGVTGSGKGGTLQIVALAHHVNGSAILYADPKGSSNPVIETMAAYSGCGLDGAIGALRIWYHGLKHRIEQSKQLGMKNFKPSPDMPWAPLILDEASQLLGAKAEHRNEATFIIKAGASLGRSLGMPVILANQIMQLDQLGGEAAIRDNLFYGGSLVLLRSDSQQKTLIDLPENFAGCNPADIPAAWSGDRDMVYDPNKPLDDPERTFGLAFAASPGAHAEMMRNWILEDATPYTDPDNVPHPADWPFWEQRHELAQISVLPDDQDNADGDLDDDGSGTSSLLTGIDLGPKKGPTAEEKILKTLEDLADPAGLEVIYTSRETISRVSGVTGSTLDNTLSNLRRKDLIHRGPERGTYAIGPAPDPE